MTYFDLTGQRFTRLLVVTRAPKSATVYVRWHCVCDCGRKSIVNSQDLRTGHTKSCGCLRDEKITARATTHGMSKTTIYAIYRGVLNRCYNSHVKAYKDYGGRGITVCDRWISGEGDIIGFECFVADMGPRPSAKHSVERENPNGNYEPENCHWALPIEQGNNKRNTRWVVYRGQEMALCDAVRAAGSVIHYEAAAIRIKIGWTVERAVETPRLHESHATKYWRSKRAA